MRAGAFALAAAALLALATTPSAAIADQPTSPNADAPFPVAIGGDFDLIDQSGARRARASFAGRRVLLFFGYAACDSICSAALPTMAQTLDALGPASDQVDAVMITVDPERDAPAAMGRGLARIDPRLIGLTGPRPSLERIWRAFRVNVELIGPDVDGRPIYDHSGFIYLLGPAGAVEAILPPVLSPDQIAAIVRRRLAGA